jgi:hypothetical protein
MPQDQAVTVTGETVRDKFTAVIRELHSHICKGNGCHRERIKPTEPLTEQKLRDWETDLIQVFSAIYRR